MLLANTIPAAPMLLLGDMDSCSNALIKHNAFIKAGKYQTDKKNTLLNYCQNQTEGQVIYRQGNDKITKTRSINIGKKAWYIRCRIELSKFFTMSESFYLLGVSCAWVL